MGGGVLLHYWHLGAAHQLLPRHLVLGIIFRSARGHPKKYFLKATARPQIRLWQKVTRNPIYLVVFFTSATPTTSKKQGEAMVSLITMAVGGFFQPN
jgi:hypothetical protein